MLGNHSNDTIESCECNDIDCNSLKAPSQGCSEAETSSTGEVGSSEGVIASDDDGSDEQSPEAQRESWGRVQADVDPRAWRIVGARVFQSLADLSDDEW
mmetsp:Transcript_139245/g.277635  ORF Transcript_139245/g.277635 Transcript_139245/m.277635 type:complete len:99 (-) Transcript_139245:42-338(-)|eukprot:CAMPEP_0172715734 /NCGR_PEP_ID=MMETSP1074-20121228/67718_1 /TAXON_ID=2916 /ORGANISM="Ceratium fusus, Strain PA161109" /LENGTH=98 /DNA_ID=CAMNT_0013540341 /DNA_START=84 /DNA_END=380 /DNA_ORIENTATION=-